MTTKDQFDGDGVAETDFEDAAACWIEAGVPEDAVPFVRALAEHLGESLDSPESATERETDAWDIDVGGEAYLVCTDAAADSLWDQSLDSYCEELVLSEIPSHLHNYFDVERWKDDARDDGRGQSLSSYDGDEAEATDPVTGTTYYIFRN